MIQTLRIRNVALIDELEIEFAPGLNVLTGETGAGKSIIVGALNLVLGARASADLVRVGNDHASVEAIFRIHHPSPRLCALLESHAIELEEAELLLSRVVSAEGRSKAYANGRLIPVSIQAAIGDELVDLHGQHDHQSLLKADRQLDLLDAFAELEDDVARFTSKVRMLREIEDRIAELENNDREQNRRIDFLRFEAEEIKKAALEPGESEDLQARRNLITNAEKIFTLASNARELLSESSDDRPALDALSRGTTNLEELAAIDARFEPIAERLRTMLREVEAISSELFDYSEEIDYDPQELDAINERLNTIRSLQRKYGETAEAILVYHDTIAEEIAAFENRDQHLEALQTERSELKVFVEKAAAALTKKRQAAGDTLTEQVTAALQELGMEDGQFTIGLEPGPLTLRGADRVEFLLTANAGEPLRPLKQVASGGEVSRIMLALKSVFAEADTIPSLIFDEVDAGIGGAVATKVAAKLRDLARSHQTLCITHLPQIAAAGATHYHVSKVTEKGKTYTRADRIEDTSRVKEVARLLDGSVTQVSLEHARTLLKKLA